MNYNEAHALAKVLKNSPEYQVFLAAKQAIAGDRQSLQLVQDFMAKQMEIEYERFSGKPEDKTKIDHLQQMYQLIANNRKAHEFLQQYMNFQRVMADVYKIIGEAVAEGLDFIAKK
jgi:cell fate (sporulation/competence/biofilm development) regulator YlbF (YheA/YmcA/DUF963 family)